VSASGDGEALPGIAPTQVNATAQAGGGGMAPAAAKAITRTPWRSAAGRRAPSPHSGASASSDGEALPGVAPTQVNATAQAGGGMAPAAAEAITRAPW
jgi:hypothetical protein